MNAELKYSQYAATHPIIQSYIHQICQYIHMLLKFCDMQDQLEIILHKNDVHSSGQVRVNDVLEVIKKGNIREQQTLIMNFANQGCIAIWKLIHIYLTKPNTIPDFINKTELEQRITRIMTHLGISRKNLQAISIQNCKKNTLCIQNKTPECSVVSQSKTGLVSMTRSIQPFEKNFRTVNNVETMYKRGLQVLQKIVPPLSSREKKFIKQEFKNAKSEYALYYKKQSPKIPLWITGYMYWSVNKDSFFYRISSQHVLIAGPSANTDLQLDIYSLFHNFDIFKSVLACIAWMGGIDHSIHEILVSAIPFGLKYDTNVKSELFKNMMKQISRTCKYKPFFSNEKVKNNPLIKYDNNRVCLNARNFNQDRGQNPNKKCMINTTFVFGRDTILIKSGWKAKGKECSDIHVMNLPWIEDKYFSTWTPKINSKLVHCAIKNGKPIMVLISDYDFNLITQNYKASNYTLEIIAKISFIQTIGPAQTAIEMCQILYYWSKNAKVFVENKDPSVADDIKYYTCWIANNKFKKNLIDITDAFKNAVIHRITATTPPDYF